MVKVVKGQQHLGHRLPGLLSCFVLSQQTLRLLVAPYLYACVPWLSYTACARVCVTYPTPVQACLMSVPSPTPTDLHHPLPCLPFSIPQHSACQWVFACPRVRYHRVPCPSTSHPWARLQPRAPPCYVTPSPCAPSIQAGARCRPYHLLNLLRCIAGEAARSYIRRHCTHPCPRPGLLYLFYRRVLWHLANCPRCRSRRQCVTLLRRAVVGGLPVFAALLWKVVLRVLVWLAWRYEPWLPLDAGTSQRRCYLVMCHRQFWRQLAFPGRVWFQSYPCPACLRLAAVPRVVGCVLLHATSVQGACLHAWVVCPLVTCVAGRLCLVPHVVGPVACLLQVCIIFCDEPPECPLRLALPRVAGQRRLPPAHLPFFCRP